MVKPPTTVIYLIVSLFLILILLSPSSDTPHIHRKHRRLKIRTTSPLPASSNDHLHNHRPHELVLFDPLVVDIERNREDREWERRYLEHAHPEILKHLHEKDAEPPAHGHVSQPEKVGVMDAEEFLNDEEKFNVTNRLVLLFPKIDVDPVDGFVSSKELIAWNLNQSEHDNVHRTRREMEIHDKNQDGFISFYEYEPPSWVQGSEHSFGFDMGWWKEEHFNASDADGDGLLNATEFNNFLHPADSKNPKLIQWLCKEELRERDTDRDGKANFSEFFHGIFYLVRNYEDVSHKTPQESDDATQATARFMFAQLDKDSDGFLSDLELMPTIDKLHPSEHYYAKQQSEYIMSQADTNKDGRLSLTEMIDNPYVFYNAIFSEEEDNGFDLHDEFR